jgi:uncharacterized SAM-binding protein YcdF (DUF218 family)
LLTRALVKPQAGQQWLLVTSAWHMPRAVGVFRRLGWSVIPYPVDYRTDGVAIAYRGFDLKGGLERFSLAAREWVGLAVYRLLGRSDAWFPAPSEPAGGAGEAPPPGAARRERRP